MKIRILAAGAAIAAFAGLAGAAQAGSYLWSFADATFTAGGTFSTNALNDIVSGGGSITGPSLSDTLTLFPNPTPGAISTSPDGAWLYDNVIPLDFDGLLFTGVVNPFYNVFVNGGGGSLGISFSDGAFYNRDNSIVGTLTVTPVPEPASWALMIGGFGLAGAAIRRRRQAVTA